MNFCAECGDPIIDNTFVFAINCCWHEDCLRCACCKCRLIDQNDHFYIRDGLSLCACHYVRLYGLGGICHVCAGRINPSEWVICVNGGQTAAVTQSTQQKFVFHLQCFACAECNARFCVGDSFVFSQGLVICGRHFQ